MIARVARESGQTLREVARESYALTLWTFLQSEESRRLESLVIERRQIDAAYLAAAAFHDPKKISVFENQWRADVTRPADTDSTREELSQRADELWAQHNAAVNRKLPVS